MNLKRLTTLLVLFIIACAVRTEDNLCLQRNTGFYCHPTDHGLAVNCPSGKVSKVCGDNEICQQVDSNVVKCVSTREFLITGDSSYSGFTGLTSLSSGIFPFPIITTDTTNPNPSPTPKPYPNPTPSPTPKPNPNPNPSSGPGCNCSCKNKNKNKNKGKNCIKNSDGRCIENGPRQ